MVFCAPHNRCGNFKIYKYTASHLNDRNKYNNVYFTMGSRRCPSITMLLLDINPQLNKNFEFKNTTYKIKIILIIIINKLDKNKIKQKSHTMFIINHIHIDINL